MRNTVASRRAGVCDLPVLSARFPRTRWGGAASEKTAEKILRERQGEPAPGRERRKGR